MKVTIFGPNLNDQSKGQMHVHAADCGDIAKMRRREPEYDNGWTIEVQTRTGIADAIYGDFDEYEDGGTTDYWLGDVHIFPCVHLEGEQ